ncbi:MAG: crossover junction endodeoxyribonuclease RuvC [Syntrophales bacterium]|nr:crossover junction endodeoxyribonuclease RuvC [Syntrophales bacterium]
MVVLGIDPGNRVTGYGVVEMGKYELLHRCCGQIVQSPRDTMPSFLARLYDALTAIVAKEGPDVVAVEDIFYGKNVRSLIKQSHVRGVAILAGTKTGLPVYEYTPLEVKKAVVGYGRAEKSQVQRMVKVILQLAESPGPDAADALAVAICHTHTQGRGRMSIVPKRRCGF